MERIKNKYPKINIKNITPREGHYFFGFYDICPWDFSGRYILSHRTGFIDRIPQKADIADICVIDTEEKSIRKVGETKAWNFQQGARLQWMPDGRKIIYNSRREDGIGATIHDLDTGDSREMLHSIYSVNPDGKRALTINYALLERLGGYGYSEVDGVESDLTPEEDGIFGVDLEKNEKELIIPINKFMKKGRDNYFTHPTFNPSGTRFCFLHRYMLDDGGVYTRLISANPDGSETYVVAEGTLSHFDWFDDNNILIWGRSKAYLTKIRQQTFFSGMLFRPVLNVLRKQVRGFIRHKVIGDKYMLFEDKTSKMKPIGENSLGEDGHPTRFDGSDWVITDTYPDKNHYRTLILYNLRSGTRTNLVKLYALPEAEYVKSYEGQVSWDLSGMRSDLHPRWDLTGTKVCIDSVHEGKKSVFIVDLEKITYEFSK